MTSRDRSRLKADGAPEREKLILELVSTNLNLMAQIAQSSLLASSMPERRGLSTDELARALTASRETLQRLAEQLDPSEPFTAPRLPAKEAELMQEINRGLPGEVWRRYGALKDKRRAATLTPEERSELITLSDRIEEMNVRRMETIVRLARLRQTSVDALMGDLGIRSPVYD